MTPASRAHRRSTRAVLVAVLASLVVGCGSPAPTPAPSPAVPSPAAAASFAANPSGSPAPLVSERPAPTFALVPWSGLDRRWGTYLSEREWGNPREAVGGNGWGLGYGLAQRTEYQFGEDGIAGLTDDRGEFHVGWAFWDGVQKRVTERLYGLTNAQGPHGETIAENRVFHENTPTHSYARYEYHYPTVQPGSPLPSLDTIDRQPGTFTIELEVAKIDSATLALRATATNTSAAPARLDVVLKGWLAPGASVTLASGGGIALQGAASVVALVPEQPTNGVEITADKGALDADLRAGLLHAGTGHIGALDEPAEIPAGGTASWTFGMAEVTGSGPATAEAAQNRAALAAAGATAVLSARRAEADGLFVRDVSAHGDLYQALLMDTLWNETWYRWDGSGASFAGTVDAHDVLIMPDKWEFPWPASWDNAFQAVGASLASPAVGQAQLRFLLSDRWQQPDGHVPCAEWVMNDECPPILAWAALEVDAAAHDPAFLRALYPALQRQYAYWKRNEAVPGQPSLYSAGFLGMDNLPRDGGAPRADASGWMAFFAGSMARIATELGDATAAAGYASDVRAIGDAVNASLWNDQDGIYEDRSSDGGFIRAPSYGGLVPLIAGIVPADRRARLVAAIGDPARFLSPSGIRSLSKASPTYQPGYATAGGVNSNWLGPVWIPLNYLLVGALEPVDPALAADIRNRVVATVEADWRATGHVHEYYDAETGQGIGADAQTGWTALVANMIREAWPAR